MFVETLLLAIRYTHDAQGVWTERRMKAATQLLCVGTAQHTQHFLKNANICVLCLLPLIVQLLSSPPPPKMSPWQPLDRSWDNVAGTWSWSLAPCVEMYLNTRSLVTCQPFFWFMQVEVFGTRDVNTLRTGSFKLFKRPFPGFLIILTL